MTKRMETLSPDTEFVCLCACACACVCVHIFGIPLSTKKHYSKYFIYFFKFYLHRKLIMKGLSSYFTDEKTEAQKN